LDYEDNKAMLRPLYRLILLLLSTTLLAASVPQNSQVLALIDPVSQLEVALAQAAIQPGATQRLEIALDTSPERRTSLILVVTYPSGAVARSLHTIDGGHGAIDWPIPIDAGVGEATYRLVADACACGAHNTIPLQNPVEGAVAGHFVIGALQ